MRRSTKVPYLSVLKCSESFADAKFREITDLQQTNAKVQVLLRNAKCRKQIGSVHQQLEIHCGGMKFGVGADNGVTGVDNDILVPTFMCVSVKLGLRSG